MVIAACLDDQDCPAGTRCLVAARYESRCGDMMPFIRVPGEAERFAGPVRKRGSVGYPCQFNVDCLADFACYKKTQGAIEGQCLQYDSTQMTSP